MNAMPIRANRADHDPPGPVRSERDTPGRELRRIVAVTAMVLIGFGHAGTAPAQDPPNVIIIVAEGLNPDVLNPMIAPNIARLAREGVTFTRAYTNSPSSMISGYALMTGITPNGLGTTRWQTPLPEAALTLADILGQRRYFTAAWGDIRTPSIRRKVDAGIPVYGFSRWFHLSQIVSQFYSYSLGDVPPTVPPEIRLKSAQVQVRDPAHHWLNVDNLPVGASFNRMPSTLFARTVAETLRQANRRRGSFHMLALKAPKPPFDYPIEYSRQYREIFTPERFNRNSAAVRYRDAFAPEKFDPPAITADEADAVPTIFRTLTDDDKRNVMAAYTTTVSFLDGCVGVLLNSIRLQNQENNTLVIFTSGSGFSLGEHGWFGPRNFYEPAVRIPLIMRFPGRFPEGREVSALVELIDIMPTVLDAVGIDIPKVVEGISLMELIEGKATKVRDAVFSEYLENEEAMIRTERFKLVYTSGKRNRQDGRRTSNRPPQRTTRLYDLRSDPEELTNLAADPLHAPIVAELKGRMLERFRASDSIGLILPDAMPLDDRLDRYLVPRETWRHLLWLWE